MKTIIELEAERYPWSLETFKLATPLSSLLKCEEEIKEIKADPNPEEYADAIMCLLDSAQRAGFTVEQILKAYDEKIKKNKARTWSKNPDNSYSHIKN